ncbi:glycoside hydrolase family 79 protein [Saccharata proteae CBS 121410]|uniref:Glycoside hydrolase family 79 protein n=1 Tax=Saccharata proteae CBS 121410 TaxID=1314787 RepID=A0A9P4I2D8_9PEZI|nr:glycoside hydrolase family 79 protein [Saccharata proteae CBS 121410]
MLAQAVLGATAAALLPVLVSSQSSSTSTYLSGCCEPTRQPHAPPIVVSGSPPDGSGGPLLEAFISYSIEFAFWPDYAGNSSIGPNTFSDNLLNNIGNFTGTKPYIRVGGNTQDYAIYDPNLSTATLGIIDPSKSTDYPTNLTIGPSFFSSYASFPSTKHIHGFNLGKNSTAARSSLLASVPVACAALSHGNLLYWEYGNEPDLYKTSSQGAVRPSDWDEQDYVDEWLDGTATIKSQLAESCPELTESWIAPSFAGTGNSLDPVVTWEKGLDEEGDIALISSHNYIGGATQPGITLSNTLLNHSKTISSISSQMNESALLTSYHLPYILGETNSLYNEGAPGLSNSFGAALWSLDFALYCASVGIKRLHFHQGTNYRYDSWQPVDTEREVKGTRAPYYGNVAAAAAVGDLTAGQVEVASLELNGSAEAAYGVYGNATLKRLAVVNMREWNYSTTADTTTATTNSTRPTNDYWFSVPLSCNGTAVVQRLMANGSDAVTGVTFNGRSFDWELEQGMPVLLRNMTKDEIAWDDGKGVFRME